MTEPTKVVQIGDRIRCSVALLRQLYEYPQHRSALVELVGVQVEEDGSKILFLNNVDIQSFK